MNRREDLAGVIRKVVEPAARDVDDRAKFPREAINALGRAGVLGLVVPARHGGGAKGLAEAVHVVEQLARVCGSTAAVLQAHFTATAILNQCGSSNVLEAIASGRHLSTVALSEVGEHQPMVPPRRPHLHGGVADLRGRKNWVVAAGEADSYIWSSRSAGERETCTLWAVPAQAPGLCVPADPEGVGLRGSAAATINADPVHVPASARLGADGAGTEIIMHAAIPWLLALDSAVSLGLMEAALQRSVETVHGPQPSWTRWQEPPSQQTEVRLDLARMRTRTDTARLVLSDAVQASVWQRPEADLRLLEAKVVASESAVQVAEMGMKVCGHFAFRKDIGIERCFRDAHAASYGQITSDGALEFIGRQVCDGSPRATAMS